MKKLFTFACALLCAYTTGWAEDIVTTEPVMVQTNSAPIVITYHADSDQGNKGLVNLPENDKVYVHAGVITNQSTGLDDWKYAPSKWGDNATKYELTRTADNTYTLTMPDGINAYYGITNPDEVVEQLVFVFRNADTSKEGKTKTGGDIYVPVYPAAFSISLSSSLAGSVISDDKEVTFTVNATATADNIEIAVNGTSIKSAANVDNLSATYSFTTEGDYTVTATATSGTSTETASLNLARLGNAKAEDYPGGAPMMGFVENADGSVTFCLAAPGKSNVVRVSSRDDYAVKAANQMKYQDFEGNRYFWITVPDIQDGADDIYYYLVDGTVSVGDPYARLVLDPYNDKYISSSVFPNLPDYPADKVQRTPLAIYNSTMSDYDWKVTDFKRVEASQLVIYELLLRDFTGTEGRADANGTVAQAIERLDYLKSLGVNAIELLPIMEFNGNNSWGYNTNFYFAPDKAYGTPSDYRRLIDEAHERGIAVILDIVFNQSDGLHPWYMMYDTASNPFYNAGGAPHGYNVLNDWKQENPLVNRQFKDALKFWLTEYKVDGFRFDLVKGLGDSDSYGATYNAATNGYTNVSDDRTNRYNATRVARMKDFHAAIREVVPDAYFINENLAGAQEENEMAADGQLNWANVNNASCQFAMGWDSDSNTARFYAPNDGNRLWGSTVSYAESHDEQRMGFKQDQWGNTGIKGDEAMSMRRLGSVAAQMLMTPGAHMIWQFQELGDNQNTKTLPNYDSNDTSPKKVVWNLLKNADHRGLLNNYKELIHARTLNPALFTEGVDVSVKCAQSDWASGRTISLASSDGEIHLAVNPNIAAEITVQLPLGKNAADYSVMSRSYGTEPKLDGTSVTLAPGAYAVFGTSNLLGVEESGITNPSVNVYGSEGTIIVEGDYSTAAAYTIGGTRVPLTGLSAGIYIVVVDGAAAKVAVR